MAGSMPVRPGYRRGASRYSGGSGDGGRDAAVPVALPGGRGVLVGQVRFGRAPAARGEAELDGLADRQRDHRAWPASAAAVRDVVARLLVDDHDLVVESGDELGHRPGRCAPRAAPRRTTAERRRTRCRTDAAGSSRAGSAPAGSGGAGSAVAPRPARRHALASRHRSWLPRPGRAAGRGGPPADPGRRGQRRRGRPRGRRASSSRHLGTGAVARPGRRPGSSARAIVAGLSRRLGRPPRRVDLRASVRGGHLRSRGSASQPASASGDRQRHRPPDRCRRRPGSDRSIRVPAGFRGTVAGGTGLTTNTRTSPAARIRPASAARSTPAPASRPTPATPAAGPAASIPAGLGRSRPAPASRPAQRRSREPPGLVSPAPRPRAGSDRNGAGSRPSRRLGQPRPAGLGRRRDPGPRRPTGRSRRDGASLVRPQRASAIAAGAGGPGRVRTSGRRNAGFRCVVAAGRDLPTSSEPAASGPRRARPVSTDHTGSRPGCGNGRARPTRVLSRRAPASHQHRVTLAPRRPAVSARPGGPHRRPPACPRPPAAAGVASGAGGVAPFGQRPRRRRTGRHGHRFGARRVAQRGLRAAAKHAVRRRTRRPPRRPPRRTSSVRSATRIPTESGVRSRIGCRPSCLRNCSRRARLRTCRHSTCPRRIATRLCCRLRRSALCQAGGSRPGRAGFDSRSVTNFRSMGWTQG